MRNLRLMGEIALLLFLVSSCVKEVSYYNEVIPKGSVIMRNQVPLRVSDNMILEIREIIDNRCPIGVVCSSAGEVKIDFKAYVDSSFVNFSMSYSNMTGEAECCTTFEGHQIQILHVNPFPYSNEEIGTNNYRVEIKVDKL